MGFYPSGVAPWRKWLVSCFFQNFQQNSTFFEISPIFFLFSAAWMCFYAFRGILWLPGLCLAIVWRDFRKNTIFSKISLTYGRNLDFGKVTFVSRSHEFLTFWSKHLLLGPLAGRKRIFGSAMLGSSIWEVSENACVANLLVCRWVKNPKSGPGQLICGLTWHLGTPFESWHQKLSNDTSFVQKSLFFAKLGMGWGVVPFDFWYPKNFRVPKLQTAIKKNCRES